MSESYHELTEILYRVPHEKKYGDKLVRQWLSEKAEELVKMEKYYEGQFSPKWYVNTILGLSKPEGMNKDEKSLEDKFKDRFNGMKFTHHILTPSGGSINMEDFIKELIRDAEQHFKNTDEDKR